MFFLNLLGLFNKEPKEEKKPIITSYKATGNFEINKELSDILIEKL